MADTPEAERVDDSNPIMRERVAALARRLDAVPPLAVALAVEAGVEPERAAEIVAGQE